MFVELEDFGQTDLNQRIREVLLNADLEGTMVLELIQNADDAGTTTVRLCLDRRPAYAQLWIPVAVVVGENEPEDKLVGWFRREVLRAGVIQECSKRRRYFENTHDKKKRKAREAARRN